MKLPAKKSLGQHFLFNPSTINKIVQLAQVNSNDRVLEIGPGPGALTRALARRAGQVIAVEKDRRFAQALRDEFASFSHVQIVEEDFLSTDLEKLLHHQKGKWKVIANLPYNIATEAIFHLLEVNQLFESFHLMVQREVADRLVAKPGSKDYGILSIFSQLLSTNRIVMKLPPGAFQPPPKVHSAVVAFQIAEGCRFSIHHLPTFETVVRSAFGQRRKMIQNTLKNAFPLVSSENLTSSLRTAGIAATVRAETVPIEKFVKLANALSSPAGPSGI